MMILLLINLVAVLVLPVLLVQQGRLAPQGAGQRVTRALQDRVATRDREVLPGRRAKRERLAR